MAHPGFGAYWGPVCEISGGHLTAASKHNLSQYKEAGFSLYTLTSFNAYRSRFNEDNSLEGTDLQAILAYCQAIGLRLIVRDETILRLSNAKIPLVATIGQPQVIMAQGAKGEIIFPEEGAHYEKGVLSYQKGDSHYEEEVSDPLFQFHSQDELNKAILSFLKPYAQEAAYAGLDLWDEPSSASFSAIGELAEAIAYADQKLGVSSRLIQCLLPSYGFANLNDFRDYLEGYATMAKGHPNLPSLLCDVYPLRRGRLQFEEGVYLGDYILKDYPLCLLYLAKAAGGHGLDLELCLQCFGDRDNLRDPSPAGLGFQIGMALAFGATGLSFYPYSHDTHGPSYTSAIVEGKGEEGYREGRLYQPLEKILEWLPQSFAFLGGFKLGHSSLFAKKPKDDFATCSSCHYYYEGYEDPSLPFQLISSSFSLLVNELENKKEALLALVNLADPDLKADNHVHFLLPASSFNVLTIKGEIRAKRPGEEEGLLILEPGETIFLRYKK